jgi:hypothetical protein
VIVRRDSPLTCLEELRGCWWAYNEPASHSGHTITLYSLIRMGARPGFFGRVVQAGFHQRAIHLVLAGAVDAAAIDSQVLAIELRDHPQRADHLRVIGSFGPSTIQPVVAASRLPGRLKHQIRELLVKLSDDPTARPLLARGFVDRFRPVDDAAYDDIRAMLATIHAAGWTSLTQTAIAHWPPTPYARRWKAPRSQSSRLTNVRLPRRVHDQNATHSAEEASVSHSRTRRVGDPDQDQGHLFSR